MARIEFDLDKVLDQLQRLKEMRMEPDMSEADSIRVRSFLLSLIIKQKKQDPVKAINNTLTLLGERHLDKKGRSYFVDLHLTCGCMTEKLLLLGVDEKVKPKIPETPSGSLPDLNGLKMIDAVSTSLGGNVSAAFAPDASASWWHKLPYICILQMKKSAALFMTVAPEKGDDCFAVVGFEDPEEAFHAGKMPVHQQLWGVLSEIKHSGAKPRRPLEGEKHFDLTWLQPREFNALMESAGCCGLVVPAGTLRSMHTSRPIPVYQIRKAIDKICSDERIGVVEAQPMESDIDVPETSTAEAMSATTEDAVAREFEESELDTMLQSEVQPETERVNGFKEEAETERVNGFKEEAETERVNCFKEEAETERVNGFIDDLELEDDVLNGLPQDPPRQEGPISPVIETNGFHSNAVAGELLRSRPISPKGPASTSSTEKPLINGTTPPCKESSIGQPSLPWWMALESVVVPKIKPAGQHGGNVEINISIDPEVADFRPILFEDEREAKSFLGILGTLHGPQTLVAITSQSPMEFLDQHTKLERERIVVLCTGSLLLDRDADREGVRNAIRLAHVATEIKKGVSPPPSNDLGEGFDERAMKVAQDVVSSFKDRMDSNARTHTQPGDVDYQDPIEGLMHDLETGGLDELFGPENEDGISAEVGGGMEDTPLQNFGSEEKEEDNDLYTQFVSQMSQNINKAQEAVQNSSPDSGASNSMSQADDLSVSLDDLIQEKEAEAQGDIAEHDEGFEVVYPEVAEDRSSHTSGSRWFEGLNVIYVPQYLTSRGATTYLAMTGPNPDERMVVGFQDRKDAMLCKEIMKTWTDKEYMAAGVSTVAPQDLLCFCEDTAVQPVVVRRASIPLALGMSQSTFFSHVGLIANAQSTNYSVFNG